MAGLHPLGESLFLVEGPVVRDMGIRFDTKMTVAKLRDGSVWIASPVSVSFQTLTEIVALGPVRYLVSPTPRHFWRLDAWHTLFPEAELWSSPITPVTLRRGDLPLTGILGDHPPGVWAGDLDQILVRGSRLLDEVVFFHAATRTLLIEDLIQIHQAQPGRPVRNAILTLGGVRAPHGGVPRDMRLAFRDKAAARRSIDRLLQWDFDRLVVAHGTVDSRTARQTVERAFAWLDDAGPTHP